jgi:hypothetical protein
LYSTRATRHEDHEERRVQEFQESLNFFDRRIVTHRVEEALPVTPVEKVLATRRISEYSVDIKDDGC